MPETAAPVVAFRFLYVVCGGPFSTYDRRFIERKRQLRRLLGRRRSRIFYLDHVEKDGKLLFEQIVKIDLEGMVCKRQNSAYRVTEKPSPYWIRVIFVQTLDLLIGVRIPACQFHPQNPPTQEKPILLGLWRLITSSSRRSDSWMQLRCATGVDLGMASYAASRLASAVDGRATARPACGHSQGGHNTHLHDSR